MKQVPCRPPRPLILFLLTCALLLPQSLELRAQQGLTGRWRTSSVPERGRELQLELEDNGVARLTVVNVATGFAETVDGECRSFTTRTTEATLVGTYRASSDSLLFRWDRTPPAQLFQKQGPAWSWSFRLAQGLTVSANGNSYSLSRGGP